MAESPPKTKSADTATLPALIQAMQEHGGSDLHLTIASPPQIRIDGNLVPLRSGPLSDERIRELCYSILTDAQRERFEAHQELDFSFDLQARCRFRGNLFMQRGTMAAVFRLIAMDAPPLKSLGLPLQILSLARQTSGLVLVTGPTGCGKSTTLASMIDVINAERRCHIMTVEDPIEFVHGHKMGVVNQREIGQDTENFGSALRHILRQDPDVVLIGEMRDLETIEAALTISETGHLVFASLHTNSAIQTINRIVNAFPPDQRHRVQLQLSYVLRAVLSQQLIPKVNGGRVAAAELLLNTHAVQHLIRDDKLHQVYSQMQVGGDRYGMVTMNQSLAALVASGAIRKEDALTRSSESEELAQLLSKGRTGRTARG